MLEWMIMPLKRFADFSGRSRRKEFWAFALLNLIVYVVLLAIVIGFGLSARESLIASAVNAENPYAIYAALFSGTGIILLIWWLAMLIPTIAVTVRRLHDRDMSGWWYLGFFIAMFIPLVSFVTGIVFLVFMCLEGTRGPNRFGPDPKDPAGVEVFS